MNTVQVAIGLKTLSGRWIIHTITLATNEKYIPLDLGVFFGGGDKFKFKGPSRNGRLLYRETE